MVLPFKIGQLNIAISLSVPDPNIFIRRSFVGFANDSAPAPFKGNHISVGIDHRIVAHSAQSPLRGSVFGPKHKNFRVALGLLPQATGVKINTPIRRP